MKKILLKNGLSVNESDGFQSVDLLISGERIEQIDSNIQSQKDWEFVDLKGKLLAPAFIDMQVHLREPGGEAKETIETGLRAAVKGGFTAVGAMPNTNPVMDSSEQIEFLIKKSETLNICQVVPVPAMTCAMEQKKLANYDDYLKQGIVAITDDGRGIVDDDLMRKIFEQAAQRNISVLQHCEFYKISDGGAFHEGMRSRALEVKGIPSASEFEMIARDIDLLRETGGHYHVLHLSTKEGVALVAKAKAEGLNVTAEATPHHLALCDEDIPSVDANFKMNPPLRSRSDRDALIKGIESGIIDMISTDHAPHLESDKQKDIYSAPFGIVGLETAFPVLYTDLVCSEKIGLSRLLELMSSAPAKIFKLEGGALRVGEIANLVVIDIESEKKVDPSSFVSKGRNTPFTGRKLKGWPVRTFYRGREIWKSE